MLARFSRIARAVWDAIFGPPRIRSLPDGSVRVRLLGRVFESATYEGLFDMVSRERERLLQSVASVHAGALGRSYLIPITRMGPGDMYQRDINRLEARLAAYNEFLGHLNARLDQPS